MLLLLGGIEESFNTKDIKDKDQFWQTMGTALKHDAMVGWRARVLGDFGCRRRRPGRVRVLLQGGGESMMPKSVSGFRMASCSAF